MAGAAVPTSPSGRGRPATAAPGRGQRDGERTSRLVGAGFLAAMVLAITGLMGIVPAADPPPRPRVVPDVVGLTPSQAESLLKRARVSFRYAEGAYESGTGSGSSWVVCTETPPAGETTREAIRLVVRRSSC